MIGIEDRVKISPANWPADAAIAPGDLTKYAPIGLGLAAPLVVMPWDTLTGVMDRGSFYGANARTGDPLQDAPINAPTGGTVYFDSYPTPRDLAGMMALLHVPLDAVRYAVFAAESTTPKTDRYLAQIRIVEFGAMSLFGASSAVGDEIGEQPLSIGGLIGVFIGAQHAVWGDGMEGNLRGTLGGDGDWASEKLSFGFMIENASRGVYRLWSRPRLVTK